MYKSRVLTTVVLCLALTAAAAQAAIIPIDADTASGNVNGTPFINASGAIYVGAVTNTGEDIRAGILFFELPVIPAGESIVSADLSILIEAVKNSSIPNNVDLYGVRTSAATTILGSDWYVGDNDAASTKIADSFMTNALYTPTPPYTEYATTDAGAPPKSDPVVMRVSSRLFIERNSHEAEASHPPAGGSQVAGGPGGVIGRA